MYKLVDEINKPNFSIYLDVGHVNSNSTRSIDYLIKGLEKKIKYVHLYNNDGMLDNHFELHHGSIIMFFDFNSNQLAIFLPGLGYTNDSPILYYTVSYLLQKETNVLRVDYRYLENEEYLNSSSYEKRQWLIKDVEAVIETVIAKQKYERIILIGKSIGTIALGEILLSNTNLIDSEVIWLTPLLKDEELTEKIIKIINRSLLILGTEDLSFKNYNKKGFRKSEYRFFNNRRSKP